MNKPMRQPLRWQPLLSCAMLLVLISTSACVPLSTPAPAPAGAGIANPASENCTQQGGKLEIRDEAQGQAGYCKFADGSECEEWALLRGECKPGQPAGQFTDPFAYCAAVGTLDQPDNRYTGPETPDAIVQGIRQATGAAADAPSELFVAGTSWRCAGGEVLACFVGANLPCGEKADTSQTPHAGIVDYCKSNPAAELVPAAAAGRATVYEWRCKAGVPQIVKQVATPDAQGFIDGIWHPIPAPAAPTSAITSTLTANSAAPDTLRRAAMLTPMDMSQSSLLSGLTGWEQAVLDKLIQAAATWMRLSGSRWTRKARWSSRSWPAPRRSWRKRPA